MNRTVLTRCANSVIVSSFIIILISLIAPVSSGMLRIRAARNNTELGADDGQKLSEELAEPFTVCLTTSGANPWPETVAEAQCDMGLHRIDSDDFVDIPLPAQSVNNWTVIIRPDDDSWIYSRSNPTADQSNYFQYVVVDTSHHAQVTPGANGTELALWLDSNRSIFSFGFTDMADMIGITTDVLYAITVSLFYGIGILRALKYLFIFLNFIG